MAVADPIKALRSFLSLIQQGSIRRSSVLERLLADAWTSLRLVGTGKEIGESGIHPKLHNVIWNSPRLYFGVECGGKNAHGSARPEMHSWEIDVEKGTRSFVRSGLGPLSSGADS